MNPVMVEPTMFCAMGFFLAALLALPFVPLVHRRAVRLTARRFEDTVPSSVVEMRADRDQLRAQFAVAIRKLEIHVDVLKGKTAAHQTRSQLQRDLATASRQAELRWEPEFEMAPALSHE
jgi:hypothetical protein